MGHAFSNSIHALADLPRWQRKTTHTKPNKATVNSEQLYRCQPADMIPEGSITNHCTIVPLSRSHQATSVNPGHYSPNTSSLETLNCLMYLKRRQLLFIKFSKKMTENVNKCRAFWPESGCLMSW